jgi:hypothetical protein
MPDDENQQEAQSHSNESPCRRRMTITHVIERETESFCELFSLSSRFKKKSEQKTP